MLLKKTFVWFLRFFSTSMGRKRVELSTEMKKLIVTLSESVKNKAEPAGLLIIQRTAIAKSQSFYTGKDIKDWGRRKKLLLGKWIGKSEWMNEWTNEWVEEWKKEQNTRANERTNGKTEERTITSADERIDGNMAWLMDGRTNGGTGGGRDRQRVGRAEGQITKIIYLHHPLLPWEGYRENPCLPGSLGKPGTVCAC